MKTMRILGSARLAVSPKRIVVHLDRAPAQHALPFGGDDLLEMHFDRAPLVGVRRQKDHADAVLAGLRQAEAVAFGLPLQEGVRHLDHDPGAIAGVRLGAARSAMGQVGQDGQRLFENLVRLFPVDIDHHAHAAGIVLELRIVQTLFGRQASPLPTRFARCLTHGFFLCFAKRVPDENSLPAPPFSGAIGDGVDLAAVRTV